jgi:hypothetical protein
VEVTDRNTTLKPDMSLDGLRAIATGGGDAERRSLDDWSPEFEKLVRRSLKHRLCGYCRKKPASVLLFSLALHTARGEPDDTEIFPPAPPTHPWHLCRDCDERVNLELLRPCREEAHAGVQRTREAARARLEELGVKPPPAAPPKPKRSRERG